MDEYVGNGNGLLHYILIADVFNDEYILIIYNSHCSMVISDTLLCHINRLDVKYVTRMYNLNKYSPSLLFIVHTFESKRIFQSYHNKFALSA